MRALPTELINNVGGVAPVGNKFSAFLPDRLSFSEGLEEIDSPITSVHHGHRRGFVSRCVLGNERTFAMPTP